MPASRLLAVGAAALLGGAGGTAIVLDVAGIGHAAAPSARVAAASTGTAHAVSDATPTAAQIYDAAKGAVAYVEAQFPDGTSTGTGFVVTSDGEIVTNAHVVEGAQSVSVKLGTGGTAQAAKVLGTDASHDLALLKVDRTGLTPLKLGDSAKVGVGDPVYAIGNPYGLDHTLTTGVVSATDRDIQGLDGSTISHVIQTDAALNPGNSGGPLLDAAGDVIGVNSQIATSGSGSDGSVGIGFAIPSDTVQQVVRALESGKGAAAAAQAEQQAQAEAQQQAQAEAQQQALYGEQPQVVIPLG